MPFVPFLSFGLFESTPNESNQFQAFQILRNMSLASPFALKSEEDYQLIGILLGIEFEKFSHPF
jgi:hypothetical protein